MNLLLFFLILNIKNFLEVKFSKNGIIFDGEIDSIWKECDSIRVYKEFYPYYDSVTNRITVIKSLQDEDNLYFLVKINYGKDKPRTALSGENDEVVIYIDPLLSKVNAYYFTITPDGSRWDGIVIQDGRRRDPSWDGVWENKIKILKNEKGEYILVSEIKIPFKTISFSEDKNEWGFQVKTYFYKNKETNFLILPDQNEGLRVSKFGLLKNVKPGSKGYGIEVFPVLLLKNNYYFARDTSLKGKTTPWLGVDIFYKKENHTLNVTILPDFAEIESDPFTMSFSKYEIYYMERRPFFIEGKNIFEPTGFGQMGFYSPVRLFYSRRIGRKMLDGTGEVPILSGVKYTYKSNRYETGFLSVLTDRKNGDWDTAYQSLWNVVRLKKYYFLNSETGILLTYKKNLEKNEYYFGGDVDGALRWGKNQVVYQLVSSVKDKEKAGFLFNSGGNMFITDKFIWIFSTRYVNDYLDISEMGFQRFYPGDKGFFTGVGYWNFPKKGKIASYSLFSGMWYTKEGYEKENSMIGMIETNVNLRNPNANLHFSVGFGKGFEKDTSFNYKSINANIWFRSSQFSLWTGFFASYDWNYNRDFLAWSSNLWGGMNFPIGSRLHLSVNLNGWMEFDTSMHYLSTTLSKNIWLTLKMTPFMHITLYVNPVSVIEKNSINVSLIRTSLYYTWEVKPKSKIHFVYNHLFNKTGNIYDTVERISAVKIRWIFLF